MSASYSCNTEQLVRELCEDRKTLLLVEDDTNDADLAKFELGERGLLVKWAWNGATALEMAKGEQFDASLIDFRLPDLNGMDVAVKLKMGYGKMVIIMCSGGKIPSAILERAHELGFTILGKGEGMWDQIAALVRN